MARKVTKDGELKDIDFTEHDIMEKLQVLKPDKCLGPDGFHPYVLRECSSAGFKENGPVSSLRWDPSVAFFPT